MSLEKRRPPLTTILLWIVGVLTLVLTGYGIFTGVPNIVLDFCKTFEVEGKEVLSCHLQW